MADPGSMGVSPFGDSLQGGGTRPTPVTGSTASPAGPPVATNAVIGELELRLSRAQCSYTEAELEKRQLERRLDEDGRQFLEHIFSLEQEIELLKQTNGKLLEEKGSLGSSRGDFDLKAQNERMQQECQDIVAQLEEFEREKEEELRGAREEAERLNKRLTEQSHTVEECKRKIAELEREKISLLEAMSEEGVELRARLDKLHRDKETLSLDLGRAQARVDHLQAQVEEMSSGAQVGSAGASEFAEASNQLRAAIAERESLKDDVTTKEGQIVLLRSQMEIAERKLRLADMESSMLKSELEVLRRQGSR